MLLVVVIDVMAVMVNLMLALPWAYSVVSRLAVVLCCCCVCCS